MRPREAVQGWTDAERSEAARLLARYGHPTHAATPKQAVMIAVVEVLSAILKRSHMRLDNQGFSIPTQRVTYEGLEHASEDDKIVRLLCHVGLQARSFVEWPGDEHSPWRAYQRSPDEVWVELAYPRLDSSKIKRVRVSLLDVRAAEDLLIHYDYNRDGWSIQHTRDVHTYEGPDAGSVQFEAVRVEAAFIPDRDET